MIEQKCKGGVKIGKYCQNKEKNVKVTGKGGRSLKGVNAGRWHEYRMRKRTGAMKNGKCMEDKMKRKVEWGKGRSE